VKGDVHDIGKNLVDIILTNNGYQVINLGIKQPIANIVQALQEHQADAIGMSGLLVKSVGVMKENLEELNNLGIDAPVLVGGAALTRPYAESELRDSYEGRLYYGKDAFEGLRIMEAISQDRLSELDAEIEERVEKRREAERHAATVRAAAAAAAAAASEGNGNGAVIVEGDLGSATATLLPSNGATSAPRRSNVARYVPVPDAPFWGTRVVTDVPLDRIYPYIDRIALFRAQWQYKQGALSEDEYLWQIKDEVEPILQHWQTRARDERILQPALVYGYFPVNADGDDLVIYDPTDQDREIERFTFPRQDGRRLLCIADFFRPVSSGVKDVLGMFCVTMGREATRATKALFDANEYTDYLHLHGFSVSCAEALAELWHARMRQELGIDGEDAPTVRELFNQKFRGGRYSPGYAACPDLADEVKIFRLLQPERIGCELTDNYQIDPEQSTTAIICHHPQAKYFNA